MLELERRDLRRERNIGLSELREPAARGSIGIEKDGVEELQVRSARGSSILSVASGPLLMSLIDRVRSRSRPPSTRLLKAMMYTTT